MGEVIDQKICDIWTGLRACGCAEGEGVGGTGPGPSSCLSNKLAIFALGACAQMTLPRGPAPQQGTFVISLIAACYFTAIVKEVKILGFTAFDKINSHLITTHNHLEKKPHIIIYPYFVINQLNLLQLAHGSVLAVRRCMGIFSFHDCLSYPLMFYTL